MFSFRLFSPPPFPLVPISPWLAPAEPDDVRSFLQTATILQQLQHNNLAKYVAVSVDHACLVNYVVVNWTKVGAGITFLCMPH